MGAPVLLPKSLGQGCKTTRQDNPFLVFKKEKNGKAWEGVFQGARGVLKSLEG